MTTHDDLIERCNKARDFPTNTCPASRHVQMIGEALVSGEHYPMLVEEPEHCGSGMLAVVASLWETRAALRKSEAALKAAREDVNDWRAQYHKDVRETQAEIVRQRETIGKLREALNALQSELEEFPDSIADCHVVACFKIIRTALKDSDPEAK